MTAQNLLGGLALEEGHLAQIASRAAQLAADASVQAILAELKNVENPLGTALTVSGTRDRFRDGFTTGTAGAPVDPAVWTLANDAPDTGNGQGHIVLPGGDSNGAAYLRVSLSPFLAGSSVVLTSKAAFTVPIRHAWGISGSQRNSGQEILFGLAESSDTDPLGINRVAQPADLPIVGTVTTNGSVQTMIVTNHGLKGNDRVVVIGNTEKRLDVGPVYVTVVDANTITVPNTVAAATYTAGGVVRVADPAALAANAALQLWGDNTASTNATFVSRRNGTKYRIATGQGAASSLPTQANGSPYSDAWLASGPQEIWANIDEVVWRSWGDGVGGMSGYGKMQQSIPDETRSYRLFARARNLDNLSRPVAKIVSIAKAGASTATVTTDVPHGLVVGDIVAISGVRDQTNFATTTGAPVATVPSATTFTLSFGAIATVTDTNGGVVWLNRGNVNAPGLLGQVVQNVTKTGSLLAVGGNTTWSGVSPGDYVQLHGTLTSGLGNNFDGAYKVQRINGVTLELAYTGTAPDQTTYNSGGAVIRRTDVRLHFARVLAHTRLLTEVLGGRGSTSDGNNAVPVALTSSVTITNQPSVNFAVNAPLSSTSLLASGNYTQGGVAITGSGTNLQPTRTRLQVMHTAGATPGLLQLQQSQDNATWRTTWQCPIPSDGLYHTFEVPLFLAYYRVVFTNGATAQTAFWLANALIRGEGTVAEDEGKSLFFPLTPAAGQAAAISASTNFPTLDLGGNHKWNVVRVWGTADQAGTYFLDESMDGSNWSPIGTGYGVTAGGVTRNEERIMSRYLRLRHVNNATTAATAVKAVLSLVTL